MVSLEIQNNESYNQYLWRIGTAIENGQLDMSWNEITPIINEKWGLNKCSSAYRKPVQYALKFYEEIWNNKSQANDSEIQDLLIELRKERIKLRDERTEYNRLIREEARKESFYNTVKQVMEDYFPVSQIDTNKVLSKTSCTYDEEVGLIIPITDLHTGIKIDNAWNKYDEEEMVKRLTKYLIKIGEVVDLHKPKDCVVVLGGDMISGIIHSSLRIENNLTVVSQIKSASIHLCQFIETLLHWFPHIKICSVVGNHSRVFPQKEQQIKGEYLDDLVCFNIETYFRNVEQVEVVVNQYDEGIATFKICGHTWFAIHGDLDSDKNTLERLTMLVGKKPDGIIRGHSHTNSMQSPSNSKVVQSGCISGIDDYCINKRIIGRPEQALVVTDNNNVIKCLYDIGLD